MAAHLIRLVAMIALIQRSARASVQIDEQEVAAIERGILALVAFQRHDDELTAAKLLERVLNYRIFADGAGRMNLSLRDTGGGLLLVPQFTLAADTRKGSRPGFSTAAAPEQAQQLFEHLVGRAHATYPTVAAGVFGAHMKVALVNDGPVTFWLQVRRPAE
jgi:D-aminoacyl-tRNA deacylase